MADENPGEAVGGGKFQGRLHHLAVEEAAIAAHDQGRALAVGDDVEDGLDEILDVAGLLEDRDLLARPKRVRSKSANVPTCK